MPRFKVSQAKSLPVRLIAVYHKLRICSTAKLVQIHPQPFPVWIDPEWHNPVEQLEKQVDERQENSQQRRNSNQLRQHLPLLRRENTRGEQAPQASHKMHR